MLTPQGLPLPETLAASLPPAERLEQGAVAIFECFQKIPCNPCADACPRGAIKIESDINECPRLDYDLCNGCGVCLAHCPGLSIFVVDYSYSPTEALVKIPYEFFPLPEPEETVAALARSGECIGEARIVKVQQMKNKTTILWLAMAKELTGQVRNIARRRKG
ncbi:MAG TPA: 4Fe-4S ferredoxin [Patescibacteria group bacterium]|nr:4Fe-4S ferredoxin [Patescibacteria group bacterium]